MIYVIIIKIINNTISMCKGYGQPDLEPSSLEIELYNLN